MQRFADADQQAAIDGLARQRVAEGELFRRLLHHELVSDQLFDELEEVLFVIMGEILQKSKIEAASSHCRQGQDLPGSLTQSIRAKLDSILHAARDMQLAKRLAIPAAVGVKDVSFRNQ